MTEHDALECVAQILANKLEKVKCPNKWRNEVVLGLPCGRQKSDDIALVSRPEGVEEEEGAEVVAGEPEIPRTLRLTTRQGRSA